VQIVSFRQKLINGINLKATKKLIYAVRKKRYEETGRSGSARNVPERFQWRRESSRGKVVETDAGTTKSDDTVEEDPIQKLESEKAELEAKNKELHNQYLMAMADFDNYRKRMIKEKQEAFDYANANL
jgi:molecular chaperone GrpE